MEDEKSKEKNKLLHHTSYHLMKRECKVMIKNVGLVMHDMMQKLCECFAITNNILSLSLSLTRCSCDCLIHKVFLSGDITMRFRSVRDFFFHICIELYDFKKIKLQYVYIQSNNFFKCV